MQRTISGLTLISLAALFPLAACASFGSAAASSSSRGSGASRCGRTGFRAGARPHALLVSHATRRLRVVTEARARLMRGDVSVGRGRLTYARVDSIYQGETAPVAAGEYELEILAESPRSATFGRVRRTVRVSP